MPLKRVTMKDIAREAGCSTASVSYVLNDVKGQKISEELRRKILQVANLYHYTQNLAGKALARGESGLIGFLYRTPRGDFEARDMMGVSDTLSSLLQRKGKRLVLVPHREREALKGMDAIIAFRLSEKRFLESANLTFSPIVSYGTDIPNSIFFSLITDPDKIDEAGKGRRILSGGRIGGEAAGVDIEEISTYQEAEAVLREGGSYLSLSPSLHEYLLARGGDSVLFPLDGEEKLSLLLDTIGRSLDEDPERWEHHLRA